MPWPEHTYIDDANTIHFSRRDLRWILEWHAPHLLSKLPEEPPAMSEKDPERKARPLISNETLERAMECYRRGMLHALDLRRAEAVARHLNPRHVEYPMSERHYFSPPGAFLTPRMEIRNQLPGALPDGELHFPATRLVGIRALSGPHKGRALEPGDLVAVTIEMRGNEVPNLMLFTRGNPPLTPVIPPENIRVDPEVWERYMAEVRSGRETDWRTVMMGEWPASPAAAERPTTADRRRALERIRQLPPHLQPDQYGGPALFDVRVMDMRGPIAAGGLARLELVAGADGIPELRLAVHRSGKPLDPNGGIEPYLGVDLGAEHPAQPVRWIAESAVPPITMSADDRAFLEAAYAAAPVNAAPLAAIRPTDLSEVKRADAPGSDLTLADVVSPTARMVGLLNDLHALDPAFLPALIERRVEVNDKIGAHPTLPVSESQGILRAGVLGLLNAIAALDGRTVTAVYNVETDRLEKFEYGPYNPASPIVVTAGPER